MGATIPAAEDWSLGWTKWIFFKLFSFVLPQVWQSESLRRQRAAHTLSLQLEHGEHGPFLFLCSTGRRWQSLEVHVVWIKGNAKKAIKLCFYVVNIVLEDSCGEKYCKLPVKGWKRKWHFFFLHVKNEHKGQQMPMTEIRKHSKWFQ